MIRRPALTLTRISLNHRPQLNPIPRFPNLKRARCLSSSPSFFPSPSISRDLWNGVPGIRFMSTRSRLTNDSSSNRPPTETILLDGCDFEHWLVVMNPPDPNCTRDQIIDGYIKTLALVIGRRLLSIILHLGPLFRRSFLTKSRVCMFEIFVTGPCELVQSSKMLDGFFRILIWMSETRTMEGSLLLMVKRFHMSPSIISCGLEISRRPREKIVILNLEETTRRRDNTMCPEIPRPSVPPTPTANPKSLDVQTYPPNYQNQSPSHVTSFTNGNVAPQAHNPQVQGPSISHQPPNNGFQNQYVRPPMQNPQSQNMYTPQNSQNQGPNYFVPSSMRNENAHYNNMQPQNSSYPGREMPTSAQNGFPSKAWPSPMQNSGYQPT